MASEAEFADIPRHELVAAALELGVERPDRFSDEELATQIRLHSSAATPPRASQPPSWLSVARNLVASVIEQGLNLPEAARVLRATVANAPRQKAPLPTVTLAQIYLAQKHTELAQTTLEHVLRRDPDNYKARQLLARLQTSQGTSGTKTSESSVVEQHVTATAPQGSTPPAAASQPELPGIAAAAVAGRAPVETPQAPSTPAEVLPFAPSETVAPSEVAPRQTTATGNLPAVSLLSSDSTGNSEPLETSSPDDRRLTDGANSSPLISSPLPMSEAVSVAEAPQQAGALSKPAAQLEVASNSAGMADRVASQLGGPSVPPAVGQAPQVQLELRRERGASDCVLRWDVSGLLRAGSGLSRSRLGIRFATFVPTPRGALQLERWIPLTDASGTLHVAVASPNVVRACVAERAPGGELRVLCVAPG